MCDVTLRRVDSVRKKSRDPWVRRIRRRGSWRARLPSRIRPVTMLAVMSRCRRVLEAG